MVPEPLLVTSFTEFERAFGGLDDVGTGTDTRNYLAYAARAFFDNGGRRLYVSRVFPFSTDANGTIDIDAELRHAGARTRRRGHLAGPLARRGRAHAISVQVGFQRSKNVLVSVNGGPT